MLEVTGPSGEHIEEAQDRELAKYRELVEQYISQGWWALCKPIEVGCKGFDGQSTCKALAGLGVNKAAKREALHSITEAEEKDIWWLWIKRASPWIAEIQFET